MIKKEQKQCFLPLPLALRDFITKPDEQIPLFLSKILEISERTTFKELCFIRIDDETKSKFDPSTISVINDLCVNIMNKKIIYSHKRLIEKDDLKEIAIEKLGFKGPKTIKVLKEAGILTSLDLSKMTFNKLARLKNFYVTNIYLSALLLEQNCIEEVHSSQHSSQENPIIIDHQEIINKVSVLNNINDIALSDPRLLPAGDYDFVVSSINKWTATNEQITLDLRDREYYVSDLLEFYEELIEGREKNLLSNLLIKITDSIIAIDKLSLAEQVLSPFNSLIGIGRKKLISKRLGLNGDDPLTLEKTSTLFTPKISRERVRQIEAKFLKKINGKEFYVPLLEQILAKIKTKAPISERQLIDYFSELNHHSFTPKSLESVCKTYNKEFPFKIRKQQGITFLIPKDDDGFGQIMKEGKKFCGRTGFVNVADLSHYLEFVREYKILDETIRSTLKEGPFIQINDDWFISKNIPDGRNRCLNVSLKMLFCVNALEPKDIREGLKRIFKVRAHLQKDWDWLIPPTEVIKESFKYIEGYTVSDDGEIRASKELIDKYKPDDTVITLKDIINDTPYKIIHSREFYKLAKSKGINASSFFMYCSYQPYIERFEPEIWGLRGSKPSPADISSLKDYLKDIPPSRTRLLESFNEKGEIEIIKKIRTVSNEVLYITANFIDYLGDSSYTMKNKAGAEYGITNLSKGNTYTGMSKALTRLGVEDDDYVRFIFNTVEKVVVIEQVPASIIWDIE